MGLLDSLVNVPERLRVWQQAGVRYFYLDPEAAPAPEPEVAQDEAEAARQPVVWPEAWQTVLAKAPTRPRLVITYAALGLDLSGRADPRRGPLWRALLRDLGLTAGNLVAFWPLSLPEGGDITPRPDVFRDGLAKLEPACLAFFGAPDPELVSWVEVGGQTRLFGRFPCVFLPDPEVLLQDDPEVWAHVVASLAPLVR